MTISSQTSRVSYSGDGATVSFAVSFRFLDDSDITVILVASDGTETDWTLGTQYTLTGEGVSAGGTLTVKTSPTDYTPASGETLIIFLDPDLLQGSALPLGGPFPSTTVETMVDRLTLICQRLSSLILRAIRQPDGDIAAISSLPPAIDRASMLLGFDADGDFEAVAPAGVSSTANIVSTYMATVLDDTTAAAARTTLGFAGTGGTVSTANIEDAAITTAKMFTSSAMAAGGKPYGRTAPANMYIAASVASSALTVAIKADGDGTGDPSAAAPVLFPRRSPTLTDGGTRVTVLDEALSLVVPSGATMGATSGTAFRLWLVALFKGDLSGDVDLGLINCLSGKDIYPLGQLSVADATLISATADSAHTIYAGEAHTADGYVVLGYMEWSSGLTTAGTWDAAPDIVEVFGPHTPLPGAEIQRRTTKNGAVVSGTTVTPEDDTIPQITEGNEVLSRTFTPTSAANLLDFETVAHVGASQADLLVAALHKTGTNDALATGSIFVSTSAHLNPIVIEHAQLAGGVTEQTFSIRLGISIAGTVAINGIAGTTARWGATLASFLRVREIMA